MLRCKACCSLNERPETQKLRFLTFASELKRERNQQLSLFVMRKVKSEIEVINVEARFQPTPSDVSVAFYSFERNLILTRTRVSGDFKAGLESCERHQSCYHPEIEEHSVRNQQARRLQKPGFRHLHRLWRSQGACEQ